MKNNKVTVVIPYYNSAPFLLRKCIDSCLRQTYNNIEVLVLTDGCKYSIDTLINDYIDNSKVRFIVSDENRGVSYRRNQGINMASGQYIMFVDSDDFIEPQTVDVMLSGIVGNNCDVAVCGRVDKYEPVMDGMFDTKVFSSMPSMFNQIQYTNYVTNKLFKIDIIRNNNIRFDENVKLGEDALFCSEYYKHAKYILTLSDGLYHYVYNGQSAMNRFDNKYLSYEQKVIKSIWNNFHRFCINPNEENTIKKWYVERVFACVGYYRVQQKKKVITKKEFRSYVKKIFEFEYLKENLSVMQIVKLKIFASPIANLIR